MRLSDPQKVLQALQRARLMGTAFLTIRGTRYQIRVADMLEGGEIAIIALKGHYELVEAFSKKGTSTARALTSYGWRWIRDKQTRAVVVGEWRR